MFTRLFNFIEVDYFHLISVVVAELHIYKLHTAYQQIHVFKYYEETTDIYRFTNYCLIRSSIGKLWYESAVLKRNWILNKHFSNIS